MNRKSKQRGYILLNSYVFGEPEPIPVYFLTTSLYPIEVVEEMNADFAGIPRGSIITTPLEMLDATFSIVSGDLVTTFFPQTYVQPFEDAFDASFTVVSGSLTETFFPRTYVQPFEDGFDASFAVVSGSLTQTFFPIYNTQLPEELEATSFSIISGSLT